MDKLIFSSLEEQEQFGSRIEEVRIYKRISKLDLSKLLGWSSVHPFNGIIKGKKNLTLEKLILIKTNFPDIDMNWLLTGKGKMLERINAEKSIADLSAENGQLKNQVLKSEAIIDTLKETNNELMQRLSK